MRPSERRLLRTRPLGSWLLGPGDEGADRLWARMRVLLTGSQVIANLVGTVLVTTLLALVIPGRPVLTADLAWLNFVAVPTYVVVALVIGTIAGTTLTRRALRWFIEDRDADRANRMATLRLPWKLTIVSAALWLIGTALFTLMYGLADSELIAKIAMTSAMGGIVVCANSYLLSEFALRPIAARALATSPPKHALGVGLTMRSVLIWLLGGIPVVGMMLVALFAVIRQNVSVTRLGVAVLVLGAIAIVTGLGLMVMNIRAMVAPIRSVTAALTKVQRGDMDTEVLVFDGTELGLLQTGFNRMVKDVRERERIRDLFGRHVGEDVAREALSRQAGLGGEVREVAVLFIDVVGSTTIAAEQPPQEVVKLLNRFFAVVVAEVHEHDGFVNKFEGDAVLAVFGAPDDLPDAAGHALTAARTMTARLLTEVPDCKAGVGVSFGPAVAGNVGAESRFEYTVIGDPVNEAARLSEHAKTVEGCVVASVHAVESAPPDEAARWRAVDEVQLRGRTEPTRIAVPVGVGS
jgi:class 3 adenylate cyclase